MVDDVYNYGIRDVKIQNSKDFDKILPSNMKLPVPGFVNQNYHIFVTTSHFNDMMKHSSTSQKLYAGFAAFKGAGEIIGNSDKLWKAMTGDSNTSPIGLMTRIAWQNKYIATMVNPRLHYVFSMHFFGVQPVMGGFGFTELKDNKIQSFGDNDWHTVLTPWEFIIHGKPVHSATDGKIIDIINKYEDRPRYDTTLQFGSWTPEEYLGNQIIIEYNKMVRIVYANMQKNRFTKRVGDIVKAGDIIGHVGCSGMFPSSYLFFSIQLAGLSAPILGNMRVTIPSRLYTWAGHMESRIVKDNEYYGGTVEGDILERFDSHKINYRYQTGKIYDMSFVKQLPRVQVE